MFKESSAVVQVGLACRDRMDVMFDSVEVMEVGDKRTRSADSNIIALRHTFHQFPSVHLLSALSSGHVLEQKLTSPVFSSTVMICPKDSCRSLIGTPRFAIFGSTLILFYVIESRSFCASCG